MLGLATDVIKRSISVRETKRIGATLTFAAAKIREKLDSGQKLRADGFFNEDSSNRAPADEIADGVVMAAQREHEEKKLKFYGNLLANLAFSVGIDRAYANFLLRSEALEAQAAELRGKISGADSISANISSAQALLANLRKRLDEPVSWEQKRRLIEVLVAGVRVGIF